MFSPTPSPISRTVQYRKITKPLLERKRRARINRCLDELKDLMFTALEAEGENVDKLEKADILEFTVKHLQKITRRDPVEEAYKFQEGFSHCASEACSFLLSLPGLDSVVGRRLVEYLAKSVSRALESQLPAAANKHPPAAVTAATISPATVTTAATSNGDPIDVAAAAAAAAAAVRSEAAARGHTPPSGGDPPAAPPGTTAPPMTPCSPQLLTAVSAAVTSPMPHQRPVALAASNRGPHTVVRPKPTRPTFGRSSSSSPQNDAAAAAAAAVAAQRDPMWRPW